MTLCTRAPAQYCQKHKNGSKLFAIVCITVKLNLTYSNQLNVKLIFFVSSSGVTSENNTKFDCNIH